MCQPVLTKDRAALIAFGIARMVGRDPGTISRELRRNAATRCGKIEYRASVAQWKADMAADNDEFSVPIEAQIIEPKASASRSLSMWLLMLCALVPVLNYGATLVGAIVIARRD